MRELETRKSFLENQQPVQRFSLTPMPLDYHERRRRDARNAAWILIGCVGLAGMLCAFVYAVRGGR